jgi:hypothetical protein
MLSKILIAIVFAAVSAYGVLLSWGTIALGNVGARAVEASRDAAADGLALSRELDPWLSVPGLQSMARQVDIQLAAGGSFDELQTKVEQSLRLTPAASADWLLLARIKLARGEPPEAVNQALEYSIVTGRYELAPMIGRVGVAIMAWSTLTPELQRQLVGEFSHIGGRLNRKQFEAFKSRIAALPETDRMAIAERLRDRYSAPTPGWVKSLGLEVKTGRQ